MKKYKLSRCTFEITRRCNKKCVHCARGDAENLTLPEWVIDKAIEEISDIEHIVIGNGEPLLEIDRIGYLIDKINGSNWTVTILELTTNGTICDRRIIDIFERFCSCRKGRSAILRISNDEFHDPAEYERAFEFYKPLVEDANKRISKKCNSFIKLRYTIENGAKHKMAYEGRAVDYIRSMGKKQEEFQLMPGTFPLYIHQISRPHRIKIIGNKISCALDILANGYVSFHELVSYKKLDALSIGNLAEKSFSNLVEDHNQKCVILCSEECVANNAKNVATYPLRNDYTLTYAKLRTVLIERIFYLRQLARERYPSIPAQDIIDGIQFPNSLELLKLIAETYERCPYYRKSMIEDIDRLSGTKKAAIYMGAICTAVLMYWNSSESRKYPYWLYGDDEDINEFLSQKFELEEKYVGETPYWLFDNVFGNEDDEETNTHKKQDDNNKVYVCNPDDINIHDVSYDSKETPSMLLEVNYSEEELFEAIKTLMANL